MNNPITRHMAEHYGSKRGWLNYHRTQLAGWAGRWRPYRRIDWQRVDRLVFICMGNICRSPLAESVASKSGYTAESMGLNCTPDRPADPRAVEFAERNGYELSGHRTRLLEPGACREGDLLVGMEPKHVGTIQQQGLAGPAQLTLLGLWHPSRPSAYIHDPYMASDRFFERCEQYVVEATLQLIESAHRAQKAWRPSTPST